MEETGPERRSSWETWSSGPVLANEAVMYAGDPEWNIGPRESVSLRLPAFQFPGVFGPFWWVPRLARWLLTPDVDSDFLGENDPELGHVGFVRPCGIRKKMLHALSPDHFLPLICICSRIHV
jgi:hypothetical protein